MDREFWLQGIGLKFFFQSMELIQGTESAMGCMQRTLYWRSSNRIVKFLISSFVYFYPVFNIIYISFVNNVNGKKETDNNYAPS